MLLAGIAITALSGAITSLFSFFADNEMLRRISLWQMGNLDGADWPRALSMGLVAIPLILVLPREGQALNAMLLGESEARHLGVDVETMKRRLILLTALGVGVAGAVSGVVAFVGLIVPHLVRLMIGPDHRYLIPGSAILGAVLLLLADTAARTLMSPAELPTGVITALLGAPFFVGLLLQQRKRMVG
jgi:iron complex transport system permease protein